MKVLSKFKINIVFSVVVFLSPVQTYAEKIVDISFSAPLFCENERSSILYAKTSFNKSSFTKITDLAYFTDGYKNQPVSNFYTANNYLVAKNVFKVNLIMLDGLNIHDYGPKDSAKKFYCTVTLDDDWRDKLKYSGDVEIYKTEDFSAECFVGPYAGKMCKTSKILSDKLHITSPYEDRKLSFESIFTYKTWNE